MMKKLQEKLRFFKIQGQKLLQLLEQRVNLIRQFMKAVRLMGQQELLRSWELMANSILLNFWLALPMEQQEPSLLLVQKDRPIPLHMSLAPLIMKLKQLLLLELKAKLIQILIPLALPMGLQKLLHLMVLMVIILNSILLLLAELLDLKLFH